MFVFPKKRAFYPKCYATVKSLALFYSTRFLFAENVCVGIFMFWAPNVKNMPKLGKNTHFGVLAVTV